MSIAFFLYHLVVISFRRLPIGVKCTLKTVCFKEMTSLQLWQQQQTKNDESITKDKNIINYPSKVSGIGPPRHTLTHRSWMPGRGKSAFVTNSI